MKKNDLNTYTLLLTYDLLLTTYHYSFPVAFL